jgi:hypothetical protein
VCFIHHGVEFRFLPNPCEEAARLACNSILQNPFTEPKSEPALHVKDDPPY